MAYSLVKGDPDREATRALWRDLSDQLRATYPDVVLLPESDIEAPVDLGLRSGFDGDFFLVNQAAHSALFNNGGAGTLPWLPDHGTASSTPTGQTGPARSGGSWPLGRTHRRATARTVASSWQQLTTTSRGCTSATGARAAPRGVRVPADLGTVPSIYYGDEIGMRYLPGLPDLEGSVCNPGYNRAGCRTPMQWDDALPNAGFSDAEPDQLYLPQDPDPHRPTVAAQLDDPHSLLHTVRRLLALRAAHPALGVGSDQQVLSRDYPFAYTRGGTHLVVVNPRREPASVAVPELADRAAERLDGSGVEVGEERKKCEGRHGHSASVRSVVGRGSNGESERHKPERHHARQET